MESRCRSRVGVTTISRELVTRSPQETEAAAARLAGQVRAGDLLLLAGDLGAGKTTFVRGLAAGMGVSGRVSSPTFQLLRIYAGTPPLAHVDLYRLESPFELSEIGLEELLDQGVVAVEWGDRLAGDWSTRTSRLDFELLDADRRVIRITTGPLEWSS